MRDEHSLDDPLLGDLFAELRLWGEQPAPAPSEALATLLAAEPERTLAGPVGQPAPQPRRKSMLVTKLAALGVAAKAALGVGVATAAVTTAGVTGVLPDQAQHAVATAVEAVTSLQLPDPLGSTTTTTLGTNGVGADGDVIGDGEGDGTGQPANHGACVSAIAKDKTVTGREHGQAVSAVAKSDCGKTTTTLGSTTTIATTTTTTTTVASAGANANRGNSGNGVGQGNAGGNSGNGGGNSGNGGGNSGNGNSGNGNGGNGNGGNSGRS